MTSSWCSGLTWDVCCAWNPNLKGRVYATLTVLTNTNFDFLILLKQLQAHIHPYSFARYGNVGTNRGLLKLHPLILQSSTFPVEWNARKVILLIAASFFNMNTVFLVIGPHMIKMNTDFTHHLIYEILLLLIFFLFPQWEWVTIKMISV